MWRTTGDIRDTWDSMSTIGFNQTEIAEYAGPGHWNDPDMLEVGNGGMTPTEYKTHMTLWSILAAPLLAGNDLQPMSREILEILINKDVIAVDQDRAGKQGTRVSKSGENEVWAKPLADGSKAVALFNRGASEATVAVNWSDVGFKRPPQRGRDLWQGKDVTLRTAQFSASVPSHGVVLLRVSEK